MGLKGVKKREREKTACRLCAGRLYGLYNGCKNTAVVAALRSMAILKRILKAPVTAWKWMADYAGFFAPLVKTVAVLITWLIRASPLFLLVALMNHPPPWSYLCYMVFIGYSSLCLLLACWIEYKRKS